MSLSLETAKQWHKVSEMAILFVIPLGLNFIIRLTDSKKLKNSRTFSAFLYFPLALFLVFIQSGYISYSIIASPVWYWIANPVPNAIISLLFAWVSLGGLLMFILLGLSYFKTKPKKEKNKQILLLLVGISFPVFGGILAEVIFPLILRLNNMPVTAPLVTIFSVFSFIAIKRYRLLQYSPRHQWGEIVNEMAEGILIVNTEDKIMYANKAFCDTAGYKFDEIRGKGAKELFIDKGDFSIIDAVQSRNKNGESDQFEIQIKTKRGENVWLNVSSSPYFDSKGNIIGSIGLQTNITRQKKNEEFLRHSEFRLKQAQAVAKIGSWDLSFSTGTGTWSEETCRIYGIDVSERENQSLESWLTFIHPEDLAEVTAKVEYSKASLKNSNFKHRIVRRDGSIRHIRTVANFEFSSSGFPIGMFGVCHDITEQVEAEVSLIESEKNMRTFISGSLMGIYFVDPATTKILYTNPALSDLLGYTAEEFREISPYTFVNHPVDDINQRIREVMDNKRLNNGERQWKRKDGKVVNVLVSSFYHRRNGTDAIYVAAQDITERKKMEEKLTATNKELELFIYKASHDIRGPLTSVMGLVNVSKLEIQDEKPRKYLDMIDTATKKLDYILGELMKAMKIKDVTLFNDNINFEELTEDVLKIFRHFPGFERLLINKSIAIEGNFLSNKPIIETILQNLIENAIKYQRISVEDPFLEIDIKGNEKGVKLAVRDNGLGIEDTFQSQIYNMYFKANENSKGSGLGLYLVKKAVEKLHGEITLKSKLGEGTLFEVLIPSQSVK
jgi:PAS domain S-box-containing protein